MAKISIEPISKSELPSYICKQMQNIAPIMTFDSDLKIIEHYLVAALARLQRCINEIKAWTPNQFDILHSSQYSIFLYYLSNTIWLNEGNKNICTRLFLLNKCLNSIDLFYEVLMPEIFFIGHSVGIVLAKASYQNYLVLYQNSTVGKNHSDAPTLEEGVIMYPNSAIIGRSRIRRGSVISQGVSVINRDTEEFKLVFNQDYGKLRFADTNRVIQQDIFRNFIK